MERRYFGTDGIRGKVGEFPINPEFVLKLGWAAGRVLAKEGRRSVVIGKDTRISGYMFESALQAGLIAGGVDVHLLGPMPTPGIAYLTRTMHAGAGIVISASHNPHYDNGIKFFSGEGTKLPDETELAIEAEIDKSMHTVESAQLGKASRVKDAQGRYIEFCKSSIPLSMDFRRLKVVVDCAHGATYHVAPSVLTELGANVITIGAEPDGININDNCGSTHPRTLQEAVLKHKADVGVALDGDGDRLILVDHKGEVVDGDEILFVIARSRHQQQTLKGGVVGTLMSNFGLEKAFSQLKIPFERAKVGDRYVLELMQKHDWLLGGESSGHIICLDRTTTGDGIVSALQVLATIVKSGRSLSELKAGMRKMPQVMINVKVKTKIDVNKNQDIQAAVRRVESRLHDNGRVLLRPSGTEPLIRVMVEGADPVEVDELARELAHEVEAAVGKAG